MNKELLLSFLRHFTPTATAFLSGLGIQLGEGADPVVTIVLAAVVYAVMQGWSFVRKVRNRPRDTS